MDDAQLKFWTFAMNTAHGIGASHESDGKSEWTRAIVSPEKWPDFNASVDVEPGMMEMTLENITQAGVGNLVEFRMQDAQTVDLRPATVIVLYLVQWSMARFEPIILRTCAPGTRIVSHSFAMATWVPEKVERFNDAGGDLRTLFLWRVGAEL